MITAEEARKIADVAKFRTNRYLQIIETAVIEAAGSGKYTAAIEHCLTDCDVPGHGYDKQIMNEISKVLYDHGYNAKIDSAKYSCKPGDTLFTCTDRGRFVVDFSEK